jgi:hypothetical protein
MTGSRRQPGKLTIGDLREPSHIQGFRDGLAYAREQAREERAKEAAAAAKALQWERSAQAAEDFLRMVGASVPESREAVSDEPVRRGSDGVLTVMQENERIWTAREVHEELKRRGWVNLDVQHPERGTEAAINRLWKAGKLAKISRGRYTAKP